MKEQDKIIGTRKKIIIEQAKKTDALDREITGLKCNMEAISIEVKHKLDGHLEEVRMELKESGNEANRNTENLSAALEPKLNELQTSMMEAMSKGILELKRNEQMRIKYTEHNTTEGPPATVTGQGMQKPQENERERAISEMGRDDTDTQR